AVVTLPPFLPYAKNFLQVLIDMFLVFTCLPRGYLHQGICQFYRGEASQSAALQILAPLSTYLHST
ncbi:hypothetical protein ACJX0J_018109, partial [Zea mays]